MYCTHIHTWRKAGGISYLKHELYENEEILETTRNVDRLQIPS